MSIREPITESALPAFTDAMLPLPSQNSTSRRHILTVGLEDWFQVSSFHNLIHRDQWYRFESRLERSTQTTLQLLDECHAKATFFVLGWVAEECPELIRAITERGHEIASRGYYHRPVTQLSRSEFRDDLLRTQEVVESAGRQRVRGYRLADQWLTPRDLWLLEVLAEEGYDYDSSLLPKFRQFASEPFRRFIHTCETPSGTITEVPPSTRRLLGLNVPVCGGNWLRQMPEALMRSSVEHVINQQPESPYVMYFHAWELDTEQPYISATDRVTRLRHYRHLDQMRELLAEYLTRYSFGTVSESLGLTVEDSAPPEAGQEIVRLHSIPQLDHALLDHASTGSAPAVTTSQPVSVVIPCYNEEATLAYLASTLERLEYELAPAYSPEFVLVDDRSTDLTWDVMNSVFGQKQNCVLVRHEVNQGVSAAIMTGITAASHEIVCSMDCDCSYDPLELRHMLPLLTDDVDLVTASPYHPEGTVKNVPAWRLLLSKGLSTIYRCVLPQKLHTWTSCFRVYRRSAIAPLNLIENRFLGTAELVAQLSINGGKIVEHPATLEVRIFGESKMKTVNTIIGHLKLIRRILTEAPRGKRQSHGTDEEITSGSN